MLLAVIAVSPFRRQLVAGCIRSGLRRARRLRGQPVASATASCTAPTASTWREIRCARGGVLQDIPRKSEEVPVSAVSQRGPFRSAEPASASTAIERARERSLGRCSEPTTAPGHRATGRFRGSSGSRSTFAPATSALGPLHDPTTGYAGSPARHTLRRSVVGGSGGGWATCRAAGSLPAGGN